MEQETRSPDVEIFVPRRWDDVGEQLKKFMSASLAGSVQVETKRSAPIDELLRELSWRRERIERETRDALIEVEKRYRDSLAELGSFYRDLELTLSAESQATGNSQFEELRHKLEEEFNEEMQRHEYTLNFRNFQEGYPSLAASFIPTVVNTIEHAVTTINIFFKTP